METSEASERGSYKGEADECKRERGTSCESFHKGEGGRVAPLQQAECKEGVRLSVRGGKAECKEGKSEWKGVEG